MPINTHPGQENVVDRHCRVTPRAKRVQPVGHDAVLWRISGHMIAFHTGHGAGLSGRSANLTRALDVICKPRPAPAPFGAGRGWVVFPWATQRAELRQRLR
jgi:hypothetical protein